MRNVPIFKNERSCVGVAFCWLCFFYFECVCKIIQEKNCDNMCLRCFTLHVRQEERKDVR